MKRRILIGLALVVALGVAARFQSVDFIRPVIERALERGLGRRVEVEEAHFNVLTGLGFTLSGVTIHEDPRAGIEPCAYVETLEARVRLLSLLSRRLEFSTLRLGEASINLVKTDAGPWNFQFLLEGASTSARAMPAIKMRGGRVNFKFGDTKSVFYFNDADLDVSPYGQGSVELRFSGAPSRADRSAQNFGHFFVRGNWTGQRLDMRVELEPSALDEAARLLDQRGFGLHGIVAFEAQLSGSPSHLDVIGQLQVDDIHRWDLLPKRGGGWHVGYKGTLDLRGERLELASMAEAPNQPLGLQFRAWDFLTTPHWDASAELKQVPLAPLVEVVRHMGVALPDKLAVEGSVSGSVHYSEPEGPSGRVELQDASLSLPDAQPLRTAMAAVAFDRQAISLEPSTVHIGESDSADLEGTYSLAAGAGLDLKITTRGLNVADLQSFGLAAIPLLDQTPQGTWRGSARYRWGVVTGEELPQGVWSGDYDLLNARIPVEGLAEPLRIQSAAVSLNGNRVTVTRLRARAGAIPFTGEYRWEPAAVRPHKFHLVVAEADAAELERLWSPVLVRERGFLARTLRLGPAPIPVWLKERRADGTLSIESLTVGDSKVHLESARMLWDGESVRLVRVKAQVDLAAVTGDVTLDLTGRSPHYRFEGKLQDVPFGGGKIDFEGNLDADGTGAQLLTNAHAEGRLRGRSVTFAPDADFRTIAGCFEMMAGPRWKFTGLEVQQGGETFYGTGATQADGRLVVDLTVHGRAVRYAGAPESLK